MGTKRLNRTIYNVVTIDGEGKTERIKSKYGSLYDHFRRELPEAGKILSCYVQTSGFDYLDELHDNSEVKNVVNRYPKKMDTIAVLKPTAIKDMDSNDAKYRGDTARYDLAVNKQELTNIIKKNVNSGREVMDIDLGNNVYFHIEYQLAVNCDKFIEDVADAYANHETSRTIGAEAILHLAVSIKEILDYKGTKEVELLENKHRWGKSYTAVIGKLSIPLHGSYGEQIKRKHPMIKVVTFDEVAWESLREVED